MLNSYRKSFFTLFAIFFVLSMPFLLILSLGFELDFESKSIQHSLTVQLETTPRNAVIKTGFRNYRTPLELKIRENNLTQIKLNLTDYHSESFVFSSQEENSALRLRDVWLLPTDPFLQFGLENYTFLNFLSQDYIILEKNDQLFVQDIGFSGLQSQPEPILLKNSELLSKTRFEILLNNVFWHPLEQVLIYKNSGNSTWQSLDLDFLPTSPISIVTFSPNQLMILDQQGVLWALNLANSNFTFLDSGFSGLSFTQTPDMLWLLKSDSIYRIERRVGNQNLNLNNLDLTKNIYTSHPTLNRQTQNNKVLNYRDFTVRSIFLGFSLEINQNLFYIDESNKSSIKKITNQAVKTGASSNTLFWLDAEINLNSYNFLHERYRHLTNLQNYFNFEDSDIKLFYYDRWNRIMLYSHNNVISYWFDNFSLNSNLVKYRPVNWIQEKLCFQEVVRNYQFCFSSDEGSIYRNNAFW